MEYSIIQSDLSRADITPATHLEAYFAAIEKSCESITLSDLERQPCPCCHGEAGEAYFEKMGFGYQSCSACGSVYVPYRPSQEQIYKFFTESEARTYWHESIFAKTTANRIANIITPTGDWIARYKDQYFNHNDVVVGEIGARTDALFRYWGKEYADSYSFIEPYMKQDIHHEIQTLDLETKQCFDILIFFDCLGHLSSLKTMLDWAQAHLKPGGLLFIKTVLADGFDLQTLAGQSNSYVPFERFFCPSKQGLLDVLTERFRLLEFSTPGQLDVANVLQAEPSSDGMERFLYQQRHETEFLRSFQQLLQMHRLSSLGQLVARKEI